MKILVLNSGSSSIKFKLYDVDAQNDQFSALCEGQADRIGIEGSNITLKVAADDSKEKQYGDLANHKVAIDRILHMLMDGEKAVLSSLEELAGVGHRVVHGGEDFTASALITDEVIDAIDRNAVLAPLHNPPNLMGIKAMAALLPDMPQVAVFDTAVHQTMPKKAYMYALPRAQYETYKIRKYGFHGTSHGYVAQKAAEQLGKPLEDLKIITCHLGNGGSLAAFMNGQSVDTTMGFTPLDGIIMGTRSGTIDPYVPLYIQETQELNPAQVSTMMNKQGGLLAISGKSDMRDNVQGAKEGDEGCRLAIEMFCYSIQKFIGSYIAVMNGVDAIVFTAGVGENNAMLRTTIMENFTFMGVEMDAAKNDANETLISTAASTVAVLKIHTNEELVIALDTFGLISGK
ncbi:acetate/propionate family kinase [Tichowtungia aerotolerans]|uniref:Acetate kinase n=1 Tax=Tichowtungia aerotolerans TaxID=2697043 RepID=A0A6P1M927_9BACT|nr:acetate kinase [Tichowtungia aerotolerans]QHI69573.1 acetate/propionate family kinase [Tichowtungia aerotolerans]